MNNVTLIDQITALLAEAGPLCDRCIHERLGTKRRQQVNACCRRHADKIATLRDTGALCDRCRRQNLRRILIENTDQSAISWQVTAYKSESNRRYRSNTPKHREHDLARRFDASLVKALRLPERAWYDSLTLEGLLELKVGYARINELITLKLTQCLLHWLAHRLPLPTLHHEAVHARMMAVSACEGGFDLDYTDTNSGINFIAEVKANIPVNGGDKFQARQLDGLDNDTLTMLGLPRRGAQGLNKKLKKRDTSQALKFLALIDTPEVRQATQTWQRRLERSQAWQQAKAKGYSIVNAENISQFTPNAVHLVFVRLETSCS